MSSIIQQAIRAKKASRLLAVLDSATKNDALHRMAGVLEHSSDVLLSLNREDVNDACEQPLASAALARMTLTPEKLQQMAVGLRAVAALEDPVGKTLLRSELDDGLELKKITSPFGVIAAIVEARPDAVTQLCALALKSGNALVLRGSSSAAHSARPPLAPHTFMTSVRGKTHRFPFGSEPDVGFHRSLLSAQTRGFEVDWWCSPRAGGLRVW